MTEKGGIIRIGNIFSVQTNGTNYKDIIDFTDTGSFIGSKPLGSLTLSGDTLYGMTQQGVGNGNIFSVQTNGMNFIDLLDFSGTSGTFIGEGPQGDLTLSGDTLYGMTVEGGVNGDGNIFSLKDTTITTSVNPLSAGSGQLKVYPNPNNGIFTIQLSVGSRQLSVLEIYNVLGEQVYTSTPPPNGGGASFSYQINMFSQPGGVYLYRVVTENGELVGQGKMVIEK
jgi:Secretion system C-terminal sorting domain